MKKTTFCSIVAASIIGLTPYAQAEELGINAQVTGTSNYMLRGVTQTSKKGALFADVTASYGNFFAGIWASNVDFSSVGVNDADTEIDYYAGYANAIGDFAFMGAYAKYTYPGSDMLDDFDELKFDLSYSFDKLTLGAKYETAIWNENDNKKLTYKEAYSAYDFGLATFNLSAGSYEDIGDNVTVGLSKAGTFAKQNVELRFNYSKFNSANKGQPFKDDNNLWGEIIFSF